MELIILLFGGILLGGSLSGGIAWLIIGAKRSPIKRGILVALLVWAIGGVYLHQRHSAEVAKSVAVYYPLITAIQEDDVDAVRRILDRGVDPNGWPLPDSDDEFCDLTPLDVAVKCKDEVIAKLLLDHGADPNGHGLSAWEDPLTDAASADNVSMMDLLFRYGGGKSKDGALQDAALEGKAKAVIFLLAHGANPDQVTDGSEGREPGEQLGKAVETYGCREIALLLEKASAKGKP
jgi:hypothetical protein